MTLKIVQTVEQTKHKFQQTIQGLNEALQKQENEDGKLIDEIVELQSFLSDPKIKQKMKRFEEIKKYFADKARTAGVVDEVVFRSKSGEVTFSKPAKSVEVVDNQGLADKLGYEVFTGIVKVPLTQLRMYLSEIELQEFTKEVTGSRSFTGARKLDK